MYFRILELYSGIGGMHCAWTESGLPGEIVTAIDINTVANHVYKHNFPMVNLITRNIQSITPSEIEKMNVNTILMSPPCQPFSRNGKYLQENDARTNSFLYLISILDTLKSLQYILMENVKGFDSSTVRNAYIDKLKSCGFVYQEFMICPSSIGIPNSRLRYYCLARRTNRIWNFITTDKILHSLPGQYGDVHPLKDYLEKSVSEDFLVPDKFLKKAYIFDICHNSSARSCCFTKAYSHYIEGTGSFYTDSSEEFLQECLQRSKQFEAGSEQFIECIKELKLRFFTPKEVLSIMAFPKNYKLPEDISRKQCYRLLGNSINVKVVSELLKLLINY